MQTPESFTQSFTLEWDLFTASMDKKNDYSDQKLNVHMCNVRTALKTQWN